MRKKVADAAKAVRRAELGLLSRLWGLALDVIWLLAVAVLVSAAVWSLYLYGRHAGWEHPALTAAARWIEAAWSWIGGGCRAGNGGF